MTSSTRSPGTNRPTLRRSRRRRGRRRCGRGRGRGSTRRRWCRPRGGRRRRAGPHRRERRVGRTSPPMTGWNVSAPTATPPSPRTSRFSGASTAAWARRRSATGAASRASTAPSWDTPRAPTKASVTRSAVAGAVDMGGGAALGDGPVEQPGRGRRAEQRADAHAARRLAEDRDVAGVAAEARDVVAHPAPAPRPGRGCRWRPSRRRRGRGGRGGGSRARRAGS